MIWYDFSVYKLNATACSLTRNNFIDKLSNHVIEYKKQDAMHFFTPSELIKARHD